MLKAFYINGIGCISAQKTFDNSGFLEEHSNYETNILPAIAPNYRDFISPAASRRMAKGVKMGVVASALALKEAGVEIPDAIITGTGMGCVNDSEKFLENILNNDEQFLTPTAFIQSTHNTVGAQIAIGLKCKAYNVTYVHAAASFESALIDAVLLLNEQDASNALVGGIEELGEHTVKLFKLIEQIKKEDVESRDLLNSKTRGSTNGEGAQFFLLSPEKQPGSYAKLKDVKIISKLDSQHVQDRLISFLQKNQTEPSAIDAIVLGNNGDAEFDPVYHDLQESLFKNTLQIAYKHLCGEYNTASAFGLWVASKILKTQQVPPVLKMNDVSPPDYKKILLYNQYRGKNHSFVLLEKV